MKKYSEMSPEELAAEKEQLSNQYKAWQAKGLKLDMSRGKPSVEQLNLSMPLFDILDGKSLMKCMNGVETRNYGQLEGILWQKLWIASQNRLSWEETLRLTLCLMR